MIDYKSVIGILTVILAFVAYIPYLRDTVKGKMRPHAFTWLVWAAANIVFSIILMIHRTHVSDNNQV